MSKAGAVMVVVLAVPGREDYTRATCWALDAAGGASTLGGRPALWWTGLEAPRFDLPPGWPLLHSVRAPEGHRRDLWRVMDAAPAGADLVVFEDDVIPCRNAVPFIVRWPGPHFATFHNLQRKPIGLAPVDTREGFQGTQAVKVPAALLARFVAAGASDPRRPHLHGNNIGGDTRITHLLIEWREQIYTHRSLVQHVGARSAHNPSATLTGRRAPAGDFDPNLDALTL